MSYLKKAEEILARSKILDGKTTPCVTQCVTDNVTLGVPPTIAGTVTPVSLSSLKKMSLFVVKNIFVFLSVNKKNILRVSLLLCIMAYFPLGARPLYTGLYSLSEKLNANNKNGVGGAVYTENDPETIVAEQASDASLESDNGIIEGVREPEEFSAPVMLMYSTYQIQKGDVIGELSLKYALNQDTLISVNSITNTRAIPAGASLIVPNQDGILHKVAAGETLKQIAEKNEVTLESIIKANELFGETAAVGTNIFLPGAKLDYAKLQEINGDLFIWPISSRRITSRYGYRVNPVSGKRGYHSGIDIGANTGVPIRAAMSGRVSSTGYNEVFGNYVVISHHAGYRTLYAHMSVIRTKSGAYVQTGERIGDVGNTGQSTGSHLHFQVYRNGVTVNPSVLMN
jgi:murein DD-endopeptidase MepM/ murein hydrolase activator NlpD